MENMENMDFEYLNGYAREMCLNKLSKAKSTMEMVKIVDFWCIAAYEQGRNEAFDDMRKRIVDFLEEFVDT